MGRGGERIETTEALSFTADKAGTIKQRGGKITWDEVCDNAGDGGEGGREEGHVYMYRRWAYRLSEALRVVLGSKACRQACM
jgi:hypothetical protein